MKTNRKSVYRAAARRACAVAFSAVLAVGLCYPPPAHAQTSQSHDRIAGASEYLTSSATHNGYWDGFTRGAADLKIGPDFRPQHDMTFLRAVTGYTSDMGPVADYQSAFRRAYARGYEDAHAGRERDPQMTSPPPPPEPTFVSARARRTPPVTPRRDSMTQIATVNGYHEGFEHGTSDRRARWSFNFRRAETYAQATTGYDPDWNLADEYRTAFRLGFASGYRDAYYGRARNRANGDSYDKQSALTSGGEARDTYKSDPRGDGTADSSQSLSRATESGYYSGHERGRYDRQVGVQEPNPKGHGAYQHALGGFDPALGDRSAYQQEFRTNFARGYSDGFSGREPTPASRP